MKVLRWIQNAAIVAAMVTAIAKINHEKGVRYEPRKPVYKQLIIVWEKGDNQ